MLFLRLAKHVLVVTVRTCRRAGLSASGHAVGLTSHSYKPLLGHRDVYALVHPRSLFSALPRPATQLIQCIPQFMTD